MSAVALAAVGVSAESLWELTWFTLPGVVTLLLALLITRRGVVLWRMLLTLQIIYVWLALSRLGDGDPRGAVNLIIPVAIFVLLTRREAREYFRDRDGRFHHNPTP